MCGIRNKTSKKVLRQGEEGVRASYLGPSENQATIPLAYTRATSVCPPTPHYLWGPSLLKTGEGRESHVTNHVSDKSGKEKSTRMYESVCNLLKATVKSPKSSDRRLQEKRIVLKFEKTSGIFKLPYPCIYYCHQLTSQSIDISLF